MAQFKIIRYTLGCIFELPKIYFSFPTYSILLKFSNFILLPLLQVDHWLRPSEIATDSSDSKIAWTVFRTPLPSDISQGNFAQSSRAKIVE